MSLKKNAIIENNFQHLFDFKDEAEEDSHNASMLMFKFLGEVEEVTDARKISRKKLANLIGTSASNVTQLFRGSRLINLLTLAKLERVLDIEFEISANKKSVGEKTEIHNELALPLSNEFNQWNAKHGFQPAIHEQMLDNTVKASYANIENTTPFLNIIQYKSQISEVA